MRKHRHSILIGSRLHLIAIASFGVIACLALGKVEAWLCQSEHLLPAVICSLLHGFAPLVGVMIINGILVHLFFRLVCSVEREFSQEDDSTVPEPDKEHHRQQVCTNPVTFVIAFLSQTEHSPPDVMLRLI
jgi:hypothetical protein